MLESGMGGQSYRDMEVVLVQSHNACVTETQKYAEGATKPGGAAAAGFFDDGKGASGEGEVVGRDHLSNTPPWNCSICKVSCTSEATLLAHARGTKHSRRCRAAAAAAEAAVLGSSVGIQQHPGATEAEDCTQV
jgi:hypothetical protein